MAELPRRRSKLVGTHPAERHDDDGPTSPRTETSPPPAPETRTPISAPEASVVSATQRPLESRPAAATPRRRGRSPAPLVTRNPRRLPRGQVSDEDMVSFNCKMSRGLRKRVRILAANNEVDIQDVVAAALEDYLAARIGSDPDDSFS